MPMTVERFALFAVLVFTWLWLGRPRRARWIEHLRDRHLALACGSAVPINLLLVVAIPMAERLPMPAGELVPALLRDLATLVIAVPLMVVGLRWKRRSSTHDSRRCRGTRVSQ
jgi:hypothetical protein